MNGIGIAGSSSVSISCSSLLFILVIFFSVDSGPVCSGSVGLVGFGSGFGSFTVDFVGSVSAQRFLVPELLE